MSVAERIQDIDKQRRSKLRVEIGEEKERRLSDFRTDEYKRKVREEAKAILQDSGARDGARQLVEGTFWGHTQETPLTSEQEPEKHIGRNLWVRLSAGGSADYWVGDGILVSANIERESVTVMSQRAPVEIEPDPKMGWTSEKRQAVEDALVAAYRKPGRYQGSAYQWGETWRLVKEPVTGK